HKVALVLKHEGEVVEAHRRIGMLGAKLLLADRERALEERFGLHISAQRKLPVLSDEIAQSTCRFLSASWYSVAADQGKREPIKPPRRRQRLGITQGTFRADCRHSLDQSAPHCVPRLAFASRRRHLTHQPVQADTVGCDRRFALVGDGIAVNECKAAERRYA